MKITESQQNEVALHIREVSESYKERLQDWRDRMLYIYKEVSTFRNITADKRAPDFKINKAIENEDKMVAKIMSKSPNWIVAPVYYSVAEEWAKETADKWADAVAAFLDKVYTQQNVIETAEIVAKNMIRYGVAWSKVDFKYEIGRNKWKKKDVVTDEETMQEFEVVDNYIEEDVVNEYPCIDSKPWTDVLFDPRYIRFEDMPAIIEHNKNVRLSYFTQNKSKYINLDKLVDCCNASTNWYDNDYSNRVQQILGIQWMGEKVTRFDKKSLDVKCYYGYYDLSEKNDSSEERLYEFWVVNDLLLVYADEISQIPFEDARCTYDTESFLWVGIIERMIWIQKEMNFQKIAASKYINKTLNPQRVRSPQSWINPKTLNDPIIVWQNGWEEALKHMYEMPHRPLPADYFNNGMDQERQIQAATFSVDTANTKTTGALSNTATWAKIDYAESNIVVEHLKRHWEDRFVRTAYKLLQVASEEMDGVITIKKKNWEWFYKIHKELLKDAVKKYNIKVEVWSTSWDSIQAKRDDAITKANMAAQAMQMWVEIDPKYIREQAFKNFDDIDTNKLFKPKIPWMDMMQQLPWQAPVI